MCRSRLALVSAVPNLNRPIVAFYEFLPVLHHLGQHKRVTFRVGDHHHFQELEEFRVTELELLFVREAVHVLEAAGSEDALVEEDKPEDQTDEAVSFESAWAVGIAPKEGEDVV